MASKSSKQKEHSHGQKSVTYRRFDSRDRGYTPWPTGHSKPKPPKAQEVPKPKAKPWAKAVVVSKGAKGSTSSKPSPKPVYVPKKGAKYDTFPTVVNPGVKSPSQWANNPNKGDYSPSSSLMGSENRNVSSDWIKAGKPKTVKPPKSNSPGRHVKTPPVVKPPVTKPPPVTNPGTTPDQGATPMYRSGVIVMMNNPAFRGYDVFAGKRPGLERPVCKPRPDDNQPKGKGGSGKKFVPWSDD